MRKVILTILFMFALQLIAFSADESIHTGTIKMTGDMYLNGSASFTGASWLYQSVPDSTTAFQILDADGGDPVFNVDTTNERIGIGEASPTHTLHVFGDIFTSGTVFTDKVVAKIGEGGTLNLFPTDNAISNWGTIQFGDHPTANMTYDATNTRLKIGTSAASDNLVVVGTAAITSNLTTGGGRTVNETIHTTTGNILTTDDLVWGDTLNGDFTLTLHDGAGGQRHTITNSGKEGNALTITSDVSDTIDGGASLVLYDGETASLHFNSTDNEWRP